MIDESRFKESPRDVGRSGTAVATAVAPSPVTTVGVESAHEYLEPGYRSRISWASVWAGVVAAFGVQVLLGVLGAAIGLSAIDAQPGDNEAQAFGIGAGIWLSLSLIIALFCGGWVAGYLAKPREPGHGALHGFLVWCTGLALAGALFAIVTGSMMGGALGGLGEQLQAVDQSTQEPLASNQPDTQDLEQARQASAGATWWTFVALILSVVAAMIGAGITAARDDLRYRRRMT